MQVFSFIFAGSSVFSLECLKILVSLKCLSLKGLITRRDALRGRGMKKKSLAVKTFADKLKLPCWTPDNLQDEDFLKQIKSVKCDFSFVCAYGKIMPPGYLQIFPQGSLNLHLSLLPKWRGAAPVQRALMAGDKHTGLCLQLMTETLDAGKIIGKRSFPVKEWDNSKDIFDQSLIEAASLFKEDLMEYLTGKGRLEEQDHRRKTYAFKIKKHEARISWNASAVSIHNKIRALYLGPQAFCLFKGKRLKIYRSQIVKNTNCKKLLAGQCIVSKNKLIVVCGSVDFLSLLEVSIEGKSRQNIKDFLNSGIINSNDQLQ